MMDQFRANLNELRFDRCGSNERRNARAGRADALMDGWE